MSDSPVKSTNESSSEETEGKSMSSTDEVDESRGGHQDDGPDSQEPDEDEDGDDEEESDDDEESEEESDDDDEADEEESDEDEDQGSPADKGQPASGASSTESDTRPKKDESKPDPLRHPEHLKTAKVFAEIAVESGPDGDLDPSLDRSRVALLLLGESLFWVQKSLGEASMQSGMSEWLASLDADLLGRVTKDEKLLTAAGHALEKQPRSAEQIEASELEALMRVTRGLIHELEAPARAAERKKALRLTKIAVSFLIGVVVLVAAIWRLVVPPDLAVGAKMTTSSSLKPCVNPTDCGSAVFHTRLQKNPWVMYDLGTAHQLSLIKVHNRSDCCYERAVPLVVETSLDAKNWTEQTRREEVFLNWEAELNVKARYVRLRVPRQVYLHLGPVVLR